MEPDELVDANSNIPALAVEYVCAQLLSDMEGSYYSHSTQDRLKDARKALLAALRAT